MSRTATTSPATTAIALTGMTESDDDDAAAEESGGG